MGIFDFMKKDKVEAEELTKKQKVSKKSKTKGSTKTSTKVPLMSTKSATETVPKKSRKKKTTKFNPIPPLTANDIAKAEATKNGEPWVAVLDVEIDIDNISNGSFSLDWNDIFIAKLVRSGYKGTDVEMVDQWFATICRNILQENYEQENADPEKRNKNKK